MFKRFTAFILSFVILGIGIMSVSAEDKGIGFVAKSSQVDSDYHFTINVTVENLGSYSVGGLNLSLCFDDKIFKVDDVSSPLSGAAVKLKEEESRVNFAWENISEELKNNQTLFTVDFSCDEKPLGNKYLMSLSCTEIYDSTDNMVKIPCYVEVKPVSFTNVKPIDLGNGISAVRVIIYTLVFLFAVSVLTVIYILVINKNELKKSGRTKSRPESKEGKNEND